jgi:hypothetical protein
MSSDVEVGLGWCGRVDCAVREVLLAERVHILECLGAELYNEYRTLCSIRLIRDAFWAGRNATAMDWRMGFMPVSGGCQELGVSSPPHVDRFPRLGE